MTTPTLTITPAAPAAGHQIVRASAALRRKALEAYYRTVIQPYTDLEAFACLSELAADLASDDLHTYLADMTWLIMGVQDSLLGIAAGPLGRWLEMACIRLGRSRVYRSVYRFGSSGFRADDQGNQVQHFWHALLVTIHFSHDFADLAARYHEWNAPGLLNWLPGTAHGHGSEMDVELSRQGIVLGQALLSGAVRPADVAAWLRRNL